MAYIDEELQEYLDKFLADNERLYRERTELRAESDRLETELESERLRRVDPERHEQLRAELAAADRELRRLRLVEKAALACHADYEFAALALQEEESGWQESMEMARELRQALAACSAPPAPEDPNAKTEESEASHAKANRAATEARSEGVGRTPARVRGSATSGVVEDHESAPTVAEPVSGLPLSSRIGLLADEFDSSGNRAGRHSNHMLALRSLAIAVGELEAKLHTTETHLLNYWISQPSQETIDLARTVFKKREVSEKGKP